MPNNSNIHYFSALGKLPEDFPSGEIYKHVDVGVVVDLETCEILDGSITLLTPTAQSFLLDKLIGQKLTDAGVEIIETELIRTYHGVAVKAVIYALRQIHERINLIAKE